MLGRFTVIMLAALLAGTAVNAPAAPSLVTGLSLTHEGDYTVVNIQGNGPVRISHQSVIAKEGKPFRIVVDCLAARHSLAQKEFTSLPTSVVTALRTSQYAVKPEEVVRVVIDLAHETVYRVETAGSVARIFVSDPKSAAFAEWTSPAVTNKTTVAAVTPPKTAAEQAKPSVVATVATPPVSAPKVPSVVSQKSPDQPAVAKAQAPAVEQPKPAAKTAPTTTYTAKPTASETKTVVAAKSQTPDQVGPAKSTTKATPATNYAAQPTTSEAKTVVAAKSQTPDQVGPAKSTTKATPATNYTAQPTTSETKTVVTAKSQTANQAEQAKKPATEIAVAKTPQQAATPAPAAKEQPAESPAVKDLPPSVMADLAKKTNQVAWLFGAAEEDKNTVPTPGDDPGVPAEDVHKAAIGTPLKPSADKAPSVSAAPPKDAAVGAPATAEKPVGNDADQALAVVAPKDVPNPSPAEDDLVVAEVSPADLLPAVDQPSKYRRDEAKRTVLKQTQVVEFPKRFVTNYDPGVDRDPFETLVDETKPTKGSIESRMANVETLYLVGLLESETGRSAALLEDLDGIGYILKPGDPVKNGYVSQIDKSAVYFQINEYGWSRTIVKELDKENSTKQ